MLIKKLCKKLNNSFLTGYVGVTSFFMFLPQLAMAEGEINKIEDLVPIDVKLKDSDSMINTVVFFIQILAVLLGLFMLVAFVNTIYSAMKDNNDDRARGGSVWGKIGVSFVLMLLGVGVAVLVFYGAPLLRTVKQA